MIIHDLSIHIIPYLIKPYDQISNILLSKVGCYRVELEVSNDVWHDWLSIAFKKPWLKKGYFVYDTMAASIS